MKKSILVVLGIAALLAVVGLYAKESNPNVRESAW